MSEYRRPGVYLTESLQTSPTQTGSATAVACFVGVASKGEASTAVRVDSWADFVQKFGGFGNAPVTDTISGTPTPSNLLSYLPYAVFSYYQNGGRVAYIVRVLPASSPAQGVAAGVTITNGATTPVPVFKINANGAGAWGNTLEVTVILQATSPAPESAMIFGLIVRLAGVEVERFTNLSMTGVEGTRPVLSAVNDPVTGSRYITAGPPTTPTLLEPKNQAWSLTSGVNPGTPAASDLVSTAVTDALHTIDGPLIVSFQPFKKQDGTIIMPPTQSLSGLNNEARQDIFVVWDGNPLSLAGSNYITDVSSRAANIGNADAFSAIYCPWIIVPDPVRPGSTISIPPSGSVQGMMVRVDSTIGVWRAPAGLPAAMASAVGTETKFTDTDQGQLNYNNINVIRTVPGNGICVMGARTRKLYGPDRYVNARRTLIYIENALRNSTTFAVFENNDSRLWTALRTTARSILQPIWEQGGLKGVTAADAYFITCDSTINTPQVIQSGEVRMEIGVALQFPAEFVVIRISQFDSGASLSAELLPA